MATTYKKKVPIMSNYLLRKAGQHGILTQQSPCCLHMASVNQIDTVKIFSVYSISRIPMFIQHLPHTYAAISLYFTYYHRILPLEI